MLGNQITKDAVWAWVAFAVVLVVGALITGWAALRAAASGDAAGSGGGVRHTGNVTVGDVSAGKGGQAAGVNYGTMTQAHHDEDP